MMQSEKALMRAVSRIDEKNSKHSFPPSAALGFDKLREHERLRETLLEQAQ